MRPIRLLLASLLLSSQAGCSVYDALFGMFGDHYASSSPDRSSRYFEMQNEIDRWESQSRCAPTSD